MAAPQVQEVFPDSPLTDDQVDAVYKLCGGDDPEIAKLKAFLGIYGVEALPESWFRTYLQDVGCRWLEALGVDLAQPSARQNLNRGILFYSGTLRALGITEELPHESTALSEINDTNPLDASLDAFEAAKGLEGFYDLLGQYRGSLGTVGSYEGFQVALVGAGLAHIVNSESRHAQPIPRRNKEASMSEEERLRGILVNMQLKFDQIAEPENDRVLPAIPSRASIDTRESLELPPFRENDRRRLKQVTTDN